MLTTTTPTDTVLATAHGEPWQGTVTAAKAKLADARAHGLHPYLIPQSAGYHLVGVASSRAEAAELAAAARFRRRAAQLRAGARVEAWVAGDIRAFVEDRP